MKSNSIYNFYDKISKKLRLSPKVNILDFIDISTVFEMKVGLVIFSPVFWGSNMTAWYY